MKDMNPKLLTLVYGVATLAYMALVAALMFEFSRWWFLALFIWHWRWSPLSENQWWRRGKK